ncbi:MAG: DUF2341 domain-containing protein, partial [Anaerolineales bacterium]|nr:DUF2341 domain-containing protein [Anaerolineales bacterium]
SFDTPSMVIPELTILLTALVILIPIVTALLTKKRRLTLRLMSIVVSLIFALSLLSQQVLPVSADPDVFYLHDTDLGSGADWYDTDWGYRNKITIDNTKVSGTADFSYFPVLVSMTESEWADTSNGGKVIQADGGDILFTSSNGTTKLDHEIESYDETNGALVAWVEVPTLDYNDDTDLYIYYGNSLDGSNQWNITGTWDEGGANNFAGVWHLDEEAAGTTALDLYEDSTSNANHGDDGVDATGQDGQIDGGQEFDDDYVAIPDPGGSWEFADGGLDAGTSDFTISAWFLRSSAMTATNPTIVYKGGGGSSAGYWFHYNKDNDEIDLRVADATLARFVANSNPSLGVTTDEWHYVTAVFDRELGLDTAYFYLNGSPAGSENSIEIADNSVSSTQNVAFGSNSFIGNLDELRIYDVVISSDW